MKVIAKVGRGTVKHMGTKQENGRISVSCGAVRHDKLTVATNAFLPYSKENITCKKCLARYEEEAQQQPEEQKIVVGMSLSVSKEEMAANRGKRIF